MVATLGLTGLVLGGLAIKRHAEREGGRAAEADSRPDARKRGDGAPTEPGSAADKAPMPRTTTLGYEAIGLNEAVSVGSTGLGLGHTAQRARAVLMSRASHTRDLGVRLVRLNSHAYPKLNVQDLSARDFDWSEADLLMQVVGEAGLDLVVVVGPWPGARTGAFTDQYLPEDLDAYEAAITRIAERYDGDGVDDMPGLPRPVLAWEVDNEPDLHHLRPPRGADGTPPRDDFQTPAEYAEIVIRTARAIRAASPDAFVISGGFYRPTSEDGGAYVAEVLQTPGVLDALDAMSVHCYFSHDSLSEVAATMDFFRVHAPEHPVWVTETSVPSDGRHVWVSEGWQAEMVVAVIGGFLAEGADRIFWHTLIEPPPREGDDNKTYGSNALLEANSAAGALGGGFRTKPAAEVFSRLLGVLGPTDPESYREVTVEGGRMLETDAGWLVFRGELTAPPEGAREVLNLTTGQTAPVGSTVAAPAWLPR